VVNCLPKQKIANAGSIILVVAVFGWIYQPLACDSSLRHNTQLVAG
jgi:hypothetical protein